MQNKEKNDNLTCVQNESKCQRIARQHQQTAPLLQLLHTDWPDDRCPYVEAVGLLLPDSGKDRVPLPNHNVAVVRGKAHTVAPRNATVPFKIYKMTSTVTKEKRMGNSESGAMYSIFVTK